MLLECNHKGINMSLELAAGRWNDFIFYLNVIFQKMKNQLFAHFTKPKHFIIWFQKKKSQKSIVNEDFILI